MIAVPPLLLDGEQSCRGQTSEVPAGGLRRDTGDAGELGGGERASVHQRLQHAGTGRITRECGHFCEHCVASHWLGSCVLPTQSYALWLCDAAVMAEIFASAAELYRGWPPLNPCGTP